MKTLVSVICLVFLIFGTALADVKVSISGGKKLVTEESTDLDVKVSLPFDEEYKIDLNNKDGNRRALVNIRIDGRAVTKDGLILRAGERVSLERFLDSGTLSKGKKFKFIPKDEESLRDDNPEDGQIIITVQYEKSDKPVVGYQGDIYSRTTTDSSSSTLTIYPTCGTTFTNTSLSTISSETYSPGITVEGSESTQRFQREKIGELEDQIDTLVIRLVGYYKTQPILLNK
uniref:Uncharacterized protein n=1 Tax=viral metagenome TaxID=1070528 RepID=A0A6H1ZAY6_9ZZZZ